MPRPTCCAFVGASLDGCIAQGDGGLDFLEPFASEDHGYEAFLAAVDSILVGRRTWEAARGLAPWPYRGKRVVVLAHGAERGVHGEAFARGDVAAVLDRMGEEGARRVYADGGAVVSQLVLAGCVDELTVSIVPRLLGDGIRLFQPPLPRRRLELVLAHAFPSGTVQLSYRVRGDGP